MQRVTRRFVLTAAAPLLCTAVLLSTPLLGTGLAQAQGTTRTVKITLEQRHVIRELVRELKVTAAKDELKVGEGDQIPGNIELQPVPPLIAQKVPSIKSHRLYVTASQILVVDPQDKRVVEVVE